MKTKEATLATKTARAIKYGATLTTKAGHVR